MGKKKKNDGLHQKVEIKLSQAPEFSIVYIGKECWKVTPHSPSAKIINVWRQLQSSGTEVLSLPSSKIVRICLEDLVKDLIQ